VQPRRDFIDMASAVAFLVGPDGTYVHRLLRVVGGGASSALMASVSMEAWPATTPADVQV
jgi:hypothetical protein